MRRRLLAFSVLVLVGGCPGDDEPTEVLGHVVRLDDASDEVLEVIAERVEQSGATVNDAAAATLADPGATIPADPAPTFMWSLPQAAGKHPRHGVNTGTFMWIRFEGAGLAEPVDVVALTSTSWTPGASDWTLLKSATGPITATMVTTVIDRGVIQSGPFKASTATRTFSIE